MKIDVFSTWQSLPLGDVAHFQNGGAWKEREYVETGVSVVRVTNCKGGTIDMTDCKFLSPSAFKKYSKYELAKDDVIVATVGSHPTQPSSVVGRSSVVPIAAVGALLNQNAVRLRAKKGVFDQRLLGYFAQSIPFKQYIAAHARGAASQVRMSIELLKEMPIKVPPLSNQIKIADLLKSYDDLIENNSRRIEILEEMVRRLYEEWFVHFRYPGHQKVKFKESKLGMIPEGWEIKPLQEVVSINPRTKVPKEGNKLFLPMGALSENSMVIETPDIKAGNSGAKFQNGDTLVARITPCLENGKTGFVDFLPGEQPTACGSTEFIVLRSISLTPQMVYLLARSDRFRDVAIKSMSGATGRQRVRVESIQELTVVQPDASSLEKFREITEPCFKQITILNSKNSNLRAQRDLLLPKLVSGEIDVSNFPMPDNNELEAA